MKADHAVVAVGIEPETSIAKESNLEIDVELGGYKVNEELEARWPSNTNYLQNFRINATAK